jgi:2-polyprenyl-3-methyl-5-hydroxy-6-metoxy-1,4-benzoquinol methylase
MVTSRRTLTHCPFCGGRITVHWRAAQVWQCRSCGLLFRNPVPGPSALSTLYKRSWSTPSEHSAETGGTTRALARLYAARLMSSLRLRNLKGLRIGAGKGAMLIELARLGAEPCALEPYGHEYLARSGLRAYRRIEDLPRSMPFDGIVMIDVIEHLTRPWEELKALRHLLVDGGFLFVSTLNSLGLNARLNGPSWREVRKEGHVLFFSEQTLRRVLAASGFALQRRLRWLVPYHAGALRGTLHSFLQALLLDGELRVLAWKS